MDSRVLRVIEGLGTLGVWMVLVSFAFLWLCVCVGLGGCRGFVFSLSRLFSFMVWFSVSGFVIGLRVCVGVGDTCLVDLFISDIGMFGLLFSCEWLFGLFDYVCGLFICISIRDLLLCY